MAAFVKSVEQVTVTMPATAGFSTITSALTKGQDASKCVPFITTHFATSVSGSNLPYNHLTSVEVFDDGGTPTVRAVRRAHSSTQGQVSVVVYVVEFADSVTVQKGSLTFTGGSTTQNISSVVQGNSFIVFNYNWNEAGSFSSDLAAAFIRASFNSNTQIQFERTLSSAYELSLFWHVVTSNGVDFQTEFIADAIGSTETGPTNIALSNSVNLANSFVVPSFEIGGYTDSVRDIGLNYALTGSSQVTFYRNSGSPTESGTGSVFVVRSNSDGLAAQHLATDVNTGATNNQTISTVDTANTAIISGHTQHSYNAHPPTSGTGGTLQWQQQTSFDLTSSTNVLLTRNTSNSIGGSNNVLRYDVVDFEIDTGGIEYTLTADQGSFAFTGLDAKTVVETKVEAEQGSFAFSGQDVAFQLGRLVAAEFGTYGFTGLDATLNLGQSLSAETGTFAFAGQDVNFGGDSVLMAEIGTFGFAGLDAKTVLEAKVEAELGAFSFTGEDAKLVAEYRVAAETGAFGFTGLPADFRVTDGTTLPAGAGGFAFDGQMVNFFYGYHLIAEAGSYSFKGLDAQLPSDDKRVAGMPSWRERNLKKRRYILPDNRVFEDADLALFELRKLLLSEKQELPESGGSEFQPDVSPQATGAALEELPPDTPGPSMMDRVIEDLPDLIEARGAEAQPIDPQLLSVLFQMIDDEEAAMLLL